MTSVARYWAGSLLGRTIPGYDQPVGSIEIDKAARVAILSGEPDADGLRWSKTFYLDDHDLEDLYRTHGQVAPAGGTQNG